MQFFRLFGNNTDTTWDDERDSRQAMRDRIRKIQSVVRNFNMKLLDVGYCFVAEAVESTVEIGIIRNGKMPLEQTATNFLRELGFQLANIKLEETTFECVSSMLYRANRCDYIEDDETVLERFGLDELSGNRRVAMRFDEEILEECDKDNLYKDAEQYLFAAELREELDRIYAGSKPNKKFAGHPVHYLLQAEDLDVKDKMNKILLGALADNHRLASRRINYVDVRGPRSFSQKFLGCIYRSAVGGTVVIDYLPGDGSESEYASAERHIISDICEVMKDFCNDVLTVIRLPYDSEKTVSTFYEYLDTLTVVKVKEDAAYGDRAKAFLKKLASETSLRADKELFSAIKEDTGYRTRELKAIFGVWYNCKLKRSVYPQYKEIKTANVHTAKEKPKGTAYDELMEMTGLEEAKKVILQAVSYYKAQRMFADKGMKGETLSMHMVFSGNPGTAKTTVARLFARIMTENGVLSGGHLVEVGRGDLVGKYIGWTAPTIQKKFQEAKGGVLFIDEAYSLVDDRDGSFGDEAINTIVQEMENHRGDVAVIFAGYPDKMEKFLQKNPGLRSRIAFHVPFADYGTEDLCEIAKLIAKRKGLSIDNGAEEKLREVFDSVKDSADFGNGRYVRNVLEKAKMAQAMRLLTMDIDTLSKRDITTIKAEDIELPPIEVNKPQKHQIGFC